MRTPEELLASGLAVIDRAFATPAVYWRGRRRIEKFPNALLPLYSGGHDSLVACHVASFHPKFLGLVYHIDTGIGSKATRKHVEDSCRELGWHPMVYKSPSTYEQFVRERGFPGPGMHQWAYIRLKERCVRMMTKRRRVCLVTGCRQQESVRRMGSVEPIKVGEPNVRDGVPTTENLNRYWLAPCFDWSVEEQAAYMEEYDLPKNPVKLALGMSGECFCGAFASPGELDRIRRHCPDVAAEIDRLAEVARACGKHDRWGTRPPGSKKGEQVAASGPLCSSCDLRAKAAGVVFKPCG
jgi:3'-phosphoadenosine 5'-phosphosulfate sulfotransferase (PAPS reductase)/FAD synthetase